MKLAPSFLFLFMLNTLQQLQSIRFSFTSPILHRRLYHSAQRLPDIHTSTRLLKYNPLSRLSMKRKMSQFATDTTSLEVTPEEEELFDTLRRVIKEENLGTEIRVAGGWVRDRLLGFQGKNDIDLALDNMLGTELADVLVAWNEKQGLPPVHYHVVQLNPEKSKHLETATMKLGNFDVDFVNLRSESYSEDSRIPAMKFGTPLEDALRRDLTINSLFYNINTRQVEDMTGRGVEDLKNGIIRSPLPAMQTLLDDPLRAFRAVRFASRFHFKLDSELRSAIQNPDVRSKLQHKVSRERVSQEILQMLSHPVSSTEASVLLYQLNLLPLVLTTYFDEVDNVIIPAERKVPDDKGDSSTNISCTERDILIPSLYHIKGLNLYLLMKLYLREQAGVSMSMSDTSNTSHTRLVYGDDWESIESNSVLRYAALMDHGRDIVYRYLLPQKKKPTFRPMMLTHFICMHQLFIGKKSADTVCLLQSGADILYNQLKDLDPNTSLQNNTIASEGIVVPSYGPFDRVTLGLRLREWGAEFPGILLLACAKLSLHAFERLVEDSQLLQDLVVVHGDSMTTHAAACNLVQAFLQQKLRNSVDSEADAEHSDILEPFAATATREKVILSTWLSQSMLTGAQKGGLVMDAVGNLGLEEEWRRPLLLSGKELKNDVLTRIPNGPIFTQVVAKQTQYELCYPNVSKSDLAEYLKSQYQEFV